MKYTISDIFDPKSYPSQTSRGAAKLMPSDVRTDSALDVQEVNINSESNLVSSQDTILNKKILGLAHDHTYSKISKKSKDLKSKSKNTKSNSKKQKKIGQLTKNLT